MTIAASALGLWGAMAETSFADWAVYRSARDRTADGVRTLAARPEDDALAAAVARSLGPQAIETTLAHFARRAADHPRSYSVQLAYAQLLLAGGRWEEAASWFKIAADLSPEAFPARWGRARALARGGDLGSAAAELRIALGLIRGSDQVRRRGKELVTVAVAIGDPETEIAARDAWARADPMNRKLALDLASVLARLGRPLEAAEVLAARENALGASPVERAGWALAEAKNREAGGDLAGASLVLGAVLRKLPAANDDLRRQIWGLAIDVARRRGTLDELRAAIAHPRDVFEWIARAQICDEGGDLVSAGVALDQAIRLAPGDLDLRRRRIAIARRVGRTRELVGLYEDLAHVAAKSGGDTAGVIADTLGELWGIGRKDVAGRLFDQALATGRGRTSLLRALAETAGRWGDEGRAVRAWTTLLRRNPSDESAIVALGELQFQRGQRRTAIETWRRLLRAGGSPVEVHVRLGELLAEHDLDAEAMAEVRAVGNAASDGAGPHRLMATILERQKRWRDAEEEWEAALRLASGPTHAALRQEVRARLVASWVRQGSGRIDAGLRRLEEAARPGDGDAVTFLVEAQLRVGRADDAMVTLRRLLAPGHDLSDTEVDLILSLVRDLRQGHRADEATAWLEELARRRPDRARDALLQLAEIALGSHADAQAMTFAARAAAMVPEDVRVSLRVASLEERLGHLDAALAGYRRIVAGSHDPAGILALTGLLERRGETRELQLLLRGVLRDGRDEEVVVAAGHRAIAVEEAAGTLEALEAFVAQLPNSQPGTEGVSARGRVLVSILSRLVPVAYRNQRRDAAARTMLDRFAGHGVRPILDLLAPDAESDAGPVEILGMLGRGVAVPVLASLIAPCEGTRDRASAGRSPAVPGDDLANAVVIALGRLGGDEARRALETIAASPKPATHLAVLWALGRVGSEGVGTLARHEIAAGGIDGAAIGCLSLGRAGGPDAGPFLLSVALDSSRPELVRRGALFGLALGRYSQTIPGLLGLLGSDDPALARAAAAGIGIVGVRGDMGMRDRLVQILNERITPSAPQPTTEGPRTRRARSATQEAMERLVAGGPQPDDALGVVGSRIEPVALFRALEERLPYDLDGGPAAGERLVPPPARTDRSRFGPGGRALSWSPSRLDLPRWPAKNRSAKRPERGIKGQDSYERRKVSNLRNGDPGRLPVLWKVWHAH